MGFLTDGHPTLIEISAFDSTTLYLKVKEVTPPGVDGGGENDTTTMHNVTFRTKQPKALRTLTECSFTAQYDPAVYDDIIAAVNVNCQITITFPDGSTLSFWGWLSKFAPGADVEGAMPIANCTIIPSNQDDSGVEQEPDYTAG